MSSQKKKLLVIHPALAPYRVDFFNSLNEHYDLHIYFLYENVPDHPFDQNKLKEASSFTAQYLTKGFAIGERVIRTNILKVIRQVKPEIVIGYEFSVSTWLMWFFKKVFRYKYRIYSICDDSVHIASTCGGLRKKSRNALVKKLDGLILTSDTIADWYRDNLNKKKKYIVFPIIADENKFRLSLQNGIPISNRFIDKFRIQNKRCVLFVGRLVALKGVDRLIRAFSKIAAKYPDARLIIVGAGNQQEHLENTIDVTGMHDKVTLAGRYEGTELHAWYNIGQVLALPSDQEAFGAVVNEALLGGANVLCSDRAGAACLIEGGVNGGIFEPFDIEGLSQLLASNLDEMPPIQHIREVRPSKMLVGYEEYVQNLVKTM